MSAGSAAGGQAPVRVWVDASFVLHLVLPDERDATIDAQWQTWAAAGTEVIGPALLYAQVTSVMRLQVTTGRLTADEGDVRSSRHSLPLGSAASIAMIRTSEPGSLPRSIRRAVPTT